MTVTLLDDPAHSSVIFINVIIIIIIIIIIWAFTSVLIVVSNWSPSGNKPHQ